MNLRTPSELIQKRIIQSVQNDKRELLKYLIFNYTPYDKSETLIKTRLLSLITNEPNCFNAPLITGSVWLTDKSNQQILVTHTKIGWDIPRRISNSDADLEATVLEYVKHQFGISATSRGLFDLDYIENENIYEICFLMNGKFPQNHLLKNSRLMTEDELNQLSVKYHGTFIRRLKKWTCFSKQLK